MKSEKRILTAFLLNLLFAVFELFGGVISGSISILSDALHDLGDSASIGISFLLEKKSKKGANAKYTYGYARYSVLGAFVTGLILLAGSCVVIYNGVLRIISPIEINYNSMIVFAIVGVCVNLFGTIFTHGGLSLNQRAVTLHLLEDVLGWLVVLIGAVVMRFTDFYLIDPIMSMAVALFILFHSVKGLKEVLEIFLEKAPGNIKAAEIKAHIERIDGVLEIHHIHIWSLDGKNNLATLHIVTDYDAPTIKERVREELNEHGISHVTVEIESSNERCESKKCSSEFHYRPCHHHHHH